MDLKNSYEELNKVMVDPAKKVPSLLAEDIKLILVQAILAYIERKISFKVVLTVAKLIEQYSKIKLPITTDEAVKDIIELERHHDVIEEILTDVLQDLVKKDYKR